MNTQVIDASDMRKNLSEVLDAARGKNIILVKRRGKVESAIVDIDSLEDMLAVQGPEYVKSIAEARASQKALTPQEAFGDLWDEV